MRSEFATNIPIPFFLLDKNFDIIEVSPKAGQLFPEIENFVEIVDPFYRSFADAFLKASADTVSTELVLEENEEKNLYHIYKSTDELGRIHVYCFPVSAEMAHLKETMNRMEETIKDFNIDLAKTKIELREAENSKAYRENIGKLAAGIAHEIRNPLTAVKGFIQLLQPQLEELGKEQYAKVALEELNRANAIISEFLNAAKPTPVQKKKTPVNKLIRETIMLYESEAILRNIKLTAAYSDDDLKLEVDGNQIKQVISNILKNAMDAIDAGGEQQEREICIKTKTESGKYSIFIKDSGCGMDPENMGKLFSPFYSTKENGTGIGLSVCKEIIEGSGGAIDVKSNPGNGTLFIISFPMS